MTAGHASVLVDDLLLSTASGTITAIISLSRGNATLRTSLSDCPGDCRLIAMVDLPRWLLRVRGILGCRSVRFD